MLVAQCTNVLWAYGLGMVTAWLAVLFLAIFGVGQLLGFIFHR